MIKFEDNFLLERLKYLEDADSHHVLAIDRNIYVKGNYFYLVLQGASMMVSMAERLIKTGVRKLSEMVTQEVCMTHINCFK